MKLNGDVLSALPHLVESMTSGGKVTALRLVETRQSLFYLRTAPYAYYRLLPSVSISIDAAPSIAHTLILRLRGSITLDARGTIIDLLSKLYHKYRHQKPAIIETAMPDIISVALDESDGIGGIRRSAFRLLVSLADDTPCR